MGLKLCRVPGREIVANFDLVSVPAAPTTKADPNGYYAALELDLGVDHTDDAVRKAYWKLAKKYHPDGSRPDEKLFRRVQMAYEVLNNTESRKRYDALDPEDRWLDEEIIAAILKNMIPLDNRKEAVAEILKGLDEPVVRMGATPAPRKPAFEDFAYYYYEDEDVPEGRIRDAWVSLVVRELIGRRQRGTVRLGFTTGPSHVIERPWGEVIMVSGDPNIQVISNMLDFTKFRSPGDS